MSASSKDARQIFPNTEKLIRRFAAASGKSHGISRVRVGATFAQATPIGMELVMSISAVASNPYAYAPLQRDSASPAPPAGYSEGIKVSDLKRLDVTLMAVPLPQEMVDRINSAMKQMFTRPLGPPDNAPENTYATVKVNGKVVATLYNSGCSAMTNAAGAAMDGLEDPPGLEGPMLAQWRAEQYAKKLGGTVEKSSTAIDQQTWNARPPREYFFDEAAMNAFLTANKASAEQRHAAYAKSIQTELPQPEKELTA
jgi:hypothetical protein